MERFYEFDHIVISVEGVQRPLRICGRRAQLQSLAHDVNEAPVITLHL